jgi:hypothetical protein
MWKQNTVKASSWLIKADPSFDQMLAKYVNRKAAPRD